MNIKEVEKVTGISSQNIRFYEKSGLVHPDRNEENGYREYDTNDIRILKLIKMFRMIDMPIEQIKLILSENHKLPQLLNEQEKMLEQKLENTRYAIRVCEHLKEICSSVEDIDADLYLSQMEEESDHYFDNWKSDYKDVVKYEHERVFTFVPEEEVTDRYTFENALYAYAMEKNKHITITKRGMYPEFVMDGVEYKAERNYTVIAPIPTAVIRCTRKDAPEKEEKYRHGRKKWIAKKAMQMIPLGSYVEGKGTYESEIEDTATYEMIMARQAADENEVDENGNLINGDGSHAEKDAKEVKTEPVTVSIEQLRDFNYLVSHYYTVDSTTMIGQEQLNVDELLAKDMHIDTSGEGPKVLIFHTHSQETFVDSVEGDVGTSIVGMGAYLSELLNAKGISTIHHDGVYDLIDGKLDRSKAYEFSEVGVRKILEENPSIEVVIDLPWHLFLRDFRPR